MDEELPRAQLLGSVGAALANWSMVELQMGLLFSILADMPNQDKARALYDGIIGFDVRLSILNRMMAFEADHTEIEAEMWRTLSARLAKFYKKRHELAHFALSEDDKGRPAIAPFLTYEKLHTKTVRYMSLAQVAERGEKFNDLHAALTWFMARAMWSRKPDKAPLPRQGTEHPHILHIRELAARNLEERKRQQQRPE